MEAHTETQAEVASMVEDRGASHGGGSVSLDRLHEHIKSHGAAHEGQDKGARGGPNGGTV